MYLLEGRGFERFSLRSCHSADGVAVNFLLNLVYETENIGVARNVQLVFFVRERARLVVLRPLPYRKRGLNSLFTHKLLYD